MLKFDDKEKFSVRFALSIFNSKALEKAIDSAADYFWDLPQDELARWANPTEADIRLKRRYWQIVSIAATNGTKHTLGELHDGICSYTHLYNNILTNRYKVAWILKPNIETEAEINKLQNDLFDNLKKILSLDNFKRDGSPNYANMKMKIKAANVIANLK